MSAIQRRSLGKPDETQPFPHGISYEVHLGELTVGRSIHEPGWQWAEHSRPIVGGASCRVHHTGFIIRGRLHVQHDDGTEAEIALCKGRTRRRIGRWHDLRDEAATPRARPPSAGGPADTRRCA